MKYYFQVKCNIFMSQKSNKKGVIILQENDIPIGNIPNLKETPLDHTPARRLFIIYLVKILHS